MKFNKDLNNNWKKDLWQSFNESDVTKLRNKLKNIRKLFDQNIENYSMNSSSLEGT